jgi:predicted nucleotide-binding protein
MAWETGSSAKMLKPSMFIGSSTEALKAAQGLKLGLEHTAEVTLWTEGVFGLNLSYLESLIKQVAKVDFAVLVLTPDDLTKSRGRQKLAPRDNVIFEFGLFMGKLGRRRCFFIHSREKKPKLPSDLLAACRSGLAGR